MHNFAFSNLPSALQFARPRHAAGLATAVLLMALSSGCSSINPQQQYAVPVAAVLDPTSALYQLDTLVVMGYLRCNDDLTRLYTTYDEARRATLMNLITVVRPGEQAGCPAQGEVELAHCSYRGKLTLPDAYAAPQLVVEELLNCTSFVDDLE